MHSWIVSFKFLNLVIMFLNRPAKSGVSGAIFIVVPGICGMCVFSPRLDINGNSVRAIDFATKVAEKYGWSTFDVVFNQQIN